MDIKINDWYELHNGYTLNFHPGYTALVGPNGAGKTTLLRQIREYANKNGISVWEYNNITHGGNRARESYLMHGDYQWFATSALSSEGEQVAINFLNKVGQLGDVIRESKQSGKPLLVLLDAIDSGASIDRARDLSDLFNMICREDISNGEEIYLIMAVNHYELAKDPFDCINVRNGNHLRFPSYESYADFICSFEDKFPRIE